VALALSHHPVSWLADGKHVGSALHAHAHVRHLRPFHEPASRKGRITVKFIISVMATTLLVSCETVMNPIGKPAPTDAGPLPSDGRYAADSGASIDGGMSDGGGGGIDDMTRLRMLGQRSDDTIQALKADALADTVEFNDAAAQFNAMVTPADLADILRLLKDLHSGAIPDRSAVDRLLARYSGLAYFKTDGKK
jgi:hypothetical protein